MVIYLNLYFIHGEKINSESSCTCQGYTVQQVRDLGFEPRTLDSWSSMRYFMCKNTRVKFFPTSDWRVD